MRTIRRMEFFDLTAFRQQHWPARRSPLRSYDPLFGSGTAFSIPALSLFGRPTVGSDFDRWQARAKRSRTIVRVHQGNNRTFEPLSDDGPASQAAFGLGIGSPRPSSKRTHSA